MATSYPFRPIVHSGLILSLDAENTKSYSGSGLDWYDLTSNGNNGTLENGPTFDFNGVPNISFLYGYIILLVVLFLYSIFRNINYNIDASRKSQKRFIILKNIHNFKLLIVNRISK